MTKGLASVHLDSNIENLGVKVERGYQRFSHHVGADKEIDAPGLERESSEGQDFIPRNSRVRGQLLFFVQYVSKEKMSFNCPLDPPIW